MASGADEMMGHLLINVCQMNKRGTVKVKVLAFSAFVVQIDRDHQYLAIKQNLWPSLADSSKVEQGEEKQKRNPSAVAVTISCLLLSMVGGATGAIFSP
ncbi:hypothetical protein AVEN_152605-1 [Araneus ventricosus]|uniref:Uncharacterized protein n=1 Tax=Araneus ventricosus TaxID=182803 RepID=A0A4Y2QR98_ARAVE|nr:hypothetical protein AVEN_152605-1 [Araneus ventricosus]